MAMSAHGRDSAGVLVRVLQVEREGAAFFEKAHVLVRDPRVREVFDRFAVAKKEQLRSLEESLKALSVPIAAGEQRKEPTYPLAEFQNAECYVCGYSTDIPVTPESCPRCGASKYTFEKEISLRRAWEIAKAGSYATLRILGEAEKEADPKVKPVLAAQISLEQKLLDEAKRQLGAAEMK